MQSDPVALSAAEADAQLRRALEDLARAKRSAVLLFAEIETRALHRELGYSSLLHYATAGLGMSQSRAYHFIRLARRLGSLPRLREAIESGQIGWTKAVQVAQVATAETETQWVEQAAASNRHELQKTIDRARRRTRQAGASAAGAVAGAEATELALEAPAGAPAPPPPEPPSAVRVRLQATAAQYARFQALLEKVRKTRKVPRGWSSMEVVLAGLEELLSQDQDEETAPESTHPESGLPDPELSRRREDAPRWQVVVHRCEECGEASTPAPGGGARRLSRAETERIGCDHTLTRPDGSSRASVPPRVRRAVLGRDRHRCTRCGATRFLEIHHRVARADGGGHQVENLVTLCSACHQQQHERLESTARALRAPARVPAESRLRVPEGIHTRNDATT